MSGLRSVTKLDNLSPRAALLLVISCQRGGKVDDGTQQAWADWIDRNGEPTAEKVRELARAIPYAFGEG